MRGPPLAFTVAAKRQFCQIRAKNKPARSLKKLRTSLLTKSELDTDYMPKSGICLALPNKHFPSRINVALQNHHQKSNDVGRWWNGRHNGLKIRRPYRRVGSTPTRPTLQKRQRLRPLAFLLLVRSIIRLSHVANAR
jgi:hypothetical protein